MFEYPVEAFVKIKELVAKEYPIHMGTLWCETWVDTHPNCMGCESETGCQKANEIAEVMIKGHHLLELVGETSTGRRCVLEGIAKRIDDILKKEKLHEFTQ
jgi:hypothetical protein